jgi:hypothetical protein
MVDRIRTFFPENDPLSGFERAANPLAFPEAIGSVSAPSQSPMSIFKSPPEYSGPLVVFLCALGIAIGAYALLPLFLSHKLALPPKDRLTVTDGYLLF